MKGSGTKDAANPFRVPGSFEKYRGPGLGTRKYSGQSIDGPCGAA